MRVPAALLVIAASFATACGEGSADSQDAPATTATSAPAKAATPTPTPGVTREEYIAIADAFCQAGNKRAKTLNARFQQLTSSAASEEEALRAVAPLLERGYENQRAQDDRFQAIKPPAADRTIIEKLWEAIDERTALLGRLADAARAQDTDRFRALIEEQQRVDDHLRGLAEGYGFRECGSRKNEAD